MCQKYSLVDCLTPRLKTDVSLVDLNQEEKETHWFLSCLTCYIVQTMNNCTITRAVDERTFVCIEEAPSLWPPGTVCQCGT